MNYMLVNHAFINYKACKPCIHKLKASKLTTHEIMNYKAC